MDNELLDDLWNDNSLLNDSIFSTFVHRLIHQYSLQIHQIPSGQLYTTFNTLLNTLRQSPTRTNHNNLFNWIYHTFHNLNEYQSFEDYLMNQDDSENIGVDIPRNPEGESDVEDEDYGGKRNPYALLEQKGHEGKFTAQFKARKPHLRHLKSLEEFAHYILSHPTEFNKISKQRANYYRNLIEKKGGMINPRDIRNSYMPEEVFLNRRKEYGKRLNYFKLVTEDLLNDVENNPLFDVPREVFLPDLIELLNKIINFLILSKKLNKLRKNSVIKIIKLFYHRFIKKIRRLIAIIKNSK